jgi:hypothetical protein
MNICKKTEIKIENFRNNKVWKKFLKRLKNINMQNLKLKA